MSFTEPPKAHAEPVATDEEPAKERHGKLTLVEPLFIDPRRRCKIYLWRCDCGNGVRASLKDVRHKLIASCPSKRCTGAMTPKRVRRAPEIIASAPEIIAPAPKAAPAPKVAPALDSSPPTPDRVRSKKVASNAEPSEVATRFQALRRRKHFLDRLHGLLQQYELTVDEQEQLLYDLLFDVTTPSNGAAPSTAATPSDAAPAPIFTPKASSWRLIPPTFPPVRTTFPPIPRYHVLEYLVREGCTRTADEMTVAFFGVSRCDVRSRVKTQIKALFTAGFLERVEDGWRATEKGRNRIHNTYDWKRSL